MSSLGKLPHPVTGAVEVDLAWARYFIDLLGMLEKKTEGNLDDGERAALEGNLATLRLNFVDVQKAQDAPLADAENATPDDTAADAAADSAGEASNED